MIVSMARAETTQNNNTRYPLPRLPIIRRHWLVDLVEAFITPRELSCGPSLQIRHCVMMERPESPTEVDFSGTAAAFECELVARCATPRDLNPTPFLESRHRAAIGCSEDPVEVYFLRPALDAECEVISRCARPHLSFKDLKVDTSVKKSDNEKGFVVKTLACDQIPRQSGFDDYFVDHGDCRFAFISPSERSRKELYSDFAYNFQQQSFELVQELGKYLSNKNDYLGCVSILQQGHGKTILMFPAIDRNKVVKFSHDHTVNMEKRFENVTVARHFCRDAGLDRLVIPRQLITSLGEYGQNVIIEERLDIDQRPVSGDDPEDLELLRQFMIFVRYSGYWDITSQNNPYTAGNKLALLDLESLEVPDWRERDSGGFYLHHRAFTRSNQKERAFFKDFSPAQLKVMRETLGAHGLDIEIEE